MGKEAPRNEGRHTASDFDMVSRLPLGVAAWALAVFLLAQVPVAAYVLRGEPGSGKVLLIAVCAAVLLIGHLTSPVRARIFRHRILGPVLWALVLGLIAYLAMALYDARIIGSDVGLRLATAVAVLAFFLERLTSFLGAVASESTAAPAALLIFVLASAAPLWLGPWVQILAAQEAVTNGVIAASPLSYLAVMADYDLLRNQWFYRNAPFGGLRYTYQGPLISGLSYTLLSLFFWFGENLKRRHGDLNTSTFFR